MKIGCPRCGADVYYEPSSRKCICNYCGSSINISEFETDELNKQDTDIYDEFHCSSCGAKLVTDKTTTITKCVFCGSQQLIKERLSGKFKPDKIIPFRITKESFIERYNAFAKKKVFAPTSYKNNPGIKDIKGLYVPYYIYSYNLKTSYNAIGRKRNKSSFDRDPQVLGVEHYNNSDIRVPVDGSVKLSDDFSTSIEPFFLDSLVDFNPGYLTGFHSECVDENEARLNDKAQRRTVAHSLKLVKDRFPDYDVYSADVVCDVNEIQEKEYALLPVWFFNTYYKGKCYSYGLNGQTGKVVGNVPISFCKMYVPFIIYSILLGYGCFWLFNIDIQQSNLFPTLLSFFLIWMTTVFLPISAIKKRYRNLKNVPNNPVAVSKSDDSRDETYSLGEYTKRYPHYLKTTVKLMINSKSTKYNHPEDINKILFANYNIFDKEE